MNPRLLLATIALPLIIFIAGLAMNIAEPDTFEQASVVDDGAVPGVVFSPDFIQVEKSEEGIPLAPPVMVKNQSAQLISYINYFGGDIEQVYERHITTSQRDTLIRILQDNDVERSEAHAALAALAKVWNPRELQLGLTIAIIYRHQTEADQSAFMGFYLRPDIEEEILLFRDPSVAGFKAEKIIREVEKREVLAENVISNSLFESGNAAGVPVGTLVEMIRVFSYTVDFQRDIRDGDSFTLFYEAYYDKDGHFARAGKILFAEMNLSGKSRGIFYYKPNNDDADFFDKTGQSVRRELLRTPVDGARISSGFGMRRHPILGYSRMHRGVDFAAPTGTPIQAAGNGVVEMRRYWGAYGNYVRIRHNNTYSTAYAHLHRFAVGLKVGDRVRQGQIIGYVGTTGRSTGPHLHYEIHRNGEQVNPLSVNLPTGQTLRGRELDTFKQYMSDINRRMNERREQNLQLARQAAQEILLPESDALLPADDTVTQN